MSLMRKAKQALYRKSYRKKELRQKQEYLKYSTAMRRRKQTPMTYKVWQKKGRESVYGLKRKTKPEAQFTKRERKQLGL